MMHVVVLPLLAVSFVGLHVEPRVAVEEQRGRTSFLRRLD